MRFYGAYDRLGVASAQCDHNRHSVCTAHIEHQPVTVLQAVMRKRQASQPVARQRIHTGLVENNFRGELENAG
jgi:hypothetical protein